jgi:hypothetical protein
MKIDQFNIEVTGMNPRQSSCCCQPFVRQTLGRSEIKLKLIPIPRRVRSMLSRKENSPGQRLSRLRNTTRVRPGLIVYDGLPFHLH